MAFFIHCGPHWYFDLWIWKLNSSTDTNFSSLLLSVSLFSLVTWRTNCHVYCIRQKSIIGVTNFSSLSLSVSLFSLWTWLSYQLPCIRQKYIIRATNFSSLHLSVSLFSRLPNEPDFPYEPDVSTTMYKAKIYYWSN